MPVGTNTVENLLRVARSEAAAGTAFAALHAGGAGRIISVPAAGSADALSSEELAELVRQATADPEFLQASVFVRTMRMSRPLTLAVAPLHKGSNDMIGLVAEHDRRFEALQLDVLERLAERLLRHLEVVQHLKGRGAREGVGTLLEPGGEPETVEWEGVWPPGESVSGDVWSGAVVSVASPSSAALPSVEPAPPAAPRPASAPRPQPAPWQAPEPTSPSTPPSGAGSWTEPDQLTGLSSLGQFFSRAGRLLSPDGRPDTAPEGRGAGSFALVVVEVPEERTTAVAARVLTKELRFSDPVARFDRRLLAAALVLFPARTGDVVEQRLAAAVRAALERQAEVRSAHVVAEPGDRRDVDELLREAVSRLQDR